MSTFAVTVEKIEVLPHTNADALELAKIGEYRAVIPKGEFFSDDIVIYIPEQSILPDNLIEHLGLTGKLSGKAKNRVKPIRLRGQLSQGIVMSTTEAIKYLQRYTERKEFTFIVGHDIADWFGITKWVPEVPANMAGKVYPAAELVRWPDVENIKRFPHIFQKGELVQITEKIHGTCCCLTYDAETDRFHVASKGIAQSNLAIEEDDANLYWRAVHTYDLEKKLRSLCEDTGARKIALFGEVYGKGVQDLGYGHDTKTLGPGFAAFDIWIAKETEQGWIDPQTVEGLCILNDIPHVPVLTEPIGYDYGEIARIAEGTTTLNNGDHIREGVVVRPIDGVYDFRHVNPEDASKFSVSRRIAKFVSEGYLMRGGNATEFE